MTQCWKALREIVVPLRHQGRHIGVLFSERGELSTAKNIFAVLPVKKINAQYGASMAAVACLVEDEHGHWRSVAELLAEPIAAQLAALIISVADSISKMACTTGSVNIFFPLPTANNAS